MESSTVQAMESVTLYVFGVWVKRRGLAKASLFSSAWLWVSATTQDSQKLSDWGMEWANFCLLFAYDASARESASE